jgi:aryl-alcohol dehydrogenase-like predicted oxidoreductase
MKYTKLGNTGLVVSRLSFGAMTFTAGNKAFPSIYKTEAADADAMIGKALEAGINFFDTADAYSGGESETMLGAALKGRRNEVVIATKVGNRTGPALVQQGLNRRHILLGVEESLKRLGTDWIDVYIVHREDPFTPLEETLEALNDIVRAGKVRYLGFSNWSAWKAAAAVEIQRKNGWAQFNHGQMTYSLLARDVERDILPMLANYGMGMTVWSPLASGFLSGKYTRENLKDANNRLSSFDIMPFDKERGFGLVEILKQMADKRQASVAQVALAWLLAKPGVSSIIVGASKPHQLHDNLEAVELSLTQEEISILDQYTELSPVYPNWFSQLVLDRPLIEALH